MATLVGEQTREASSGRRVIWLCGGTARAVSRLARVGAGTAPLRRTETESKAGVLGAMPWTRRCRVAACKGVRMAQEVDICFHRLVRRARFGPDKRADWIEDGPAAIASFGFAFYCELIAPRAVVDDRETRQDF